MEEVDEIYEFGSFGRFDVICSYQLCWQIQRNATSKKNNA
jgi:hypothetical protein